MRLKMLTTGPNKNYKVGQVVEVDGKRAEILVKGKHAEEVRSGIKHIQERKGL